MIEKHISSLLPVGKDGTAINKSITPGGKIFILYFTGKVNLVFCFTSMVCAHSGILFFEK